MLKTSRSFTLTPLSSNDLKASGAFMLSPVSYTTFSTLILFFFASLAPCSSNRWANGSVLLIMIYAHCVKSAYDVGYWVFIIFHSLVFVLSPPITLNTLASSNSSSPSMISYRLDWYKLGQFHLWIARCWLLGQQMRCHGCKIIQKELRNLVETFHRGRHE